MKAPHQLSFLFLLGAFIISGLYQYYRSTINEVPAYDSFGLQEILMYLVAIGISSVSLIDKNWASLLIIGFCVLAIGVAFGFYLPVIYPLRTNNWIDTGESVVYLIFILLAGIFSYLAIRNRKASKK